MRASSVADIYEYTFSYWPRLRLRYKSLQFPTMTGMERTIALIIALQFSGLPSGSSLMQITLGDFRTHSIRADSFQPQITLSDVGYVLFKNITVYSEGFVLSSLSVP